MGDDASISVPVATTRESRDEDNSIATVHTPGLFDWEEQRLEPGESVDIELADGTTIAVVEIDPVVADY